MSFRKKKTCFLVFLKLMGVFIFSHATTFVLPTTGDVVGEPLHELSEGFETVDEIGKRFDVGYHELLRANPHIDFKHPLTANSQLIIPSQYILPQVQRKGIVINLAEYRLYYFPENENVVLTFPVGIGRKGWKTPLGVTKIIAKEANPKWRPTKKLRLEAEKNGDFLPTEFPSGPYNPLGQYALRLGWSTFLIHGTNRHDGIGTRVSAGCIRMYPDDIELLFRVVPVGTQVRVINEHVKIGRKNEALVLQIVPMFSEERNIKLQTVLEKKLAGLYKVNWNTHKMIQSELAYPTGLVRKI